MKKIDWLRKIALFFFVVITLVAIGCGIYLFTLLYDPKGKILFLHVLSRGGASVIVGSVIWVILFAIFVYPFLSKYEQKFNQYYLFDVLHDKTAFQDIQYDPEKGVSFEQLNRLGIVNMGTSSAFRSNHQLQFQYQNHSFDVQQIKTGKEKVSRRSVETINMFQGTYIHFPILLNGQKKLQIVQNVKTKYPIIQRHLGYIMPVQNHPIGQSFFLCVEQEKDAFNPSLKIQELLLCLNQYCPIITMMIDETGIDLALYHRNLFEVHFFTNLKTQVMLFQKDAQDLQAIVDILIQLTQELNQQ